MTQTIIGPQSDFQYNYLNSDARILIAGGAAGSSKSYIGLMRHLRWIHDRNYKGFCIRKNMSAITKSGGLFDEAVGLYRSVDPGLKVKLKDCKVIFSTGAEISFSHYENTQAGQNLYHGLQISGIMYDEASQAEEQHIWWLFSRLRSKAKCPHSIWLTANPDPDSFLFNWVEPYIYPKGHKHEGRADPDKNGHMRYFIRKNGYMNWGESPEKLKKLFGEHVRPISFQVLLGTIYDNPVLMESNPEYLDSLEALPRVERERLLLGNWLVRQESTGFFKREWIEEVDLPATKDVVQRVRAWDIAGSLKSETAPDPDYTVGVLMAKLRDGTYIVEDVIRFRARYGEVMDKIIETGIRDGTNVDIILPEEPGAAGRMATALMVSEITSRGFFCRKKPTNKSKIERFRPFASAAEHKLVKFVKRCGYDLENKQLGTNEFVFNEMEIFDGSRNHHDDIPDAISDAFSALATSLHIPAFTIPDLKSSNPFTID